MANAFYAGCAAAGLTDIPHLKYSAPMINSLKKMIEFAEGALSMSLLVIVDEVHKRLIYFDELKSTFESFAQTQFSGGQVTIVSSSTSGNVAPLFGHACTYLDLYNRAVIGDELKLLKEKHGSLNSNILREPTSFLQTIRIL
jgi:bifunctional pyridoxal-dependent enzyme with beta-cystathionase and maltose regulon repressor activities